MIKMRVHMVIFLLPEHVTIEIKKQIQYWVQEQIPKLKNIPKKKNE